jgi:hypothetical protein
MMATLTQTPAALNNVVVATSSAMKISAIPVALNSGSSQSSQAPGVFLGGIFKGSR